MSFKLIQMQFPKYIITIFLLIYSNILYSIELDPNFKSNWAGIEVMGVDPIVAQEIRNLMPIKTNASFKASEAKHYCSLCKMTLKKNINIDATCSIVWYEGNIAYLIVDAPTVNHAPFRIIPKNKSAIKIIPKELNTLFLKWEKRVSHLMSNGNFTLDKMDEGFRGSHDPVLHKMAVKLTRLVSKYNHDILEVLHHSPYVIERQKAASLLAWSNHAENLHYVLEWDLLTDPDSGVRNDVARSFLAFMNKIEDEKLLANLIPAYCKQAILPKHSDRNKALNSILGILAKHPKLVNAISPECKNNIEYISNASILDNIKNPAKNILRLVEVNNHE